MRCRIFHYREEVHAVRNGDSRVLKVGNRHRELRCLAFLPCFDILLINLAECAISLVRIDESYTGQREIVATNRQSISLQGTHQFSSKGQIRIAAGDGQISVLCREQIGGACLGSYDAFGIFSIRKVESTSHIIIIDAECHACCGISKLALVYFLTVSLACSICCPVDLLRTRPQNGAGIAFSGPINRCELMIKVYGSKGEVAAFYNKATRFNLCCHGLGDVNRHGRRSSQRYC